MLKKYSAELQAALGFLVLQFLFKITFEVDGGSQSTVVPLIYFVYFFLPMITLTTVLCLLRQHSGYILGMIYGLLHILLVALLISTANVPVGNSLLKPLNVMITCSFITYFLYREYSRERKEDVEPAAGNSVLVTLYFNLCWLALMAVSIFTSLTTQNVRRPLPALSGDVLNNPLTVVFLALSGIATIGLIVIMLLERKQVNKSAITFGALQVFALISLVIASQVTLLMAIMGSMFALAIIVTTLLGLSSTLHMGG